MTDLEKALAELLAEVTGMANDLQAARRRIAYLEQQHAEAEDEMRERAEIWENRKEVGPDF